MAPAAECSTRAKEAVIWALAQQNPDFPAFYDEYQQEITLTAPLPPELVDRVFEVVEQDPSLAPTARRCLENAQAAAAFAIPGLAEAGILIAALFLLGSHIKLQRSKDGQWEFLFERQPSENSALEKVMDLLSGLFKG